MFGLLLFHLWFTLGLCHVSLLVYSWFVVGLSLVYFGLDWFGFNVWFTVQAYLEIVLSLCSVFVWCL